MKNKTFAVIAMISLFFTQVVPSGWAVVYTQDTVVTTQPTTKVADSTSDTKAADSSAESQADPTLSQNFMQSGSPLTPPTVPVTTSTTNIISGTMAANYARACASSPNTYQCVYSSADPKTLSADPKTWSLKEAHYFSNSLLRYVYTFNAQGNVASIRTAATLATDACSGTYCKQNDTAGKLIAVYFYTTSARNVVSQRQIYNTAGEKTQTDFFGATGSNDASRRTQVQYYDGTSAKLITGVVRYTNGKRIQYDVYRTTPNNTKASSTFYDSTGSVVRQVENYDSVGRLTSADFYTNGVLTQNQVWRLAPNKKEIVTFYDSTGLNIQEVDNYDSNGFKTRVDFYTNGVVTQRQDWRISPNNSLASVTFYNNAGTAVLQVQNYYYDKKKTSVDFYTNGIVTQRHVWRTTPDNTLATVTFYNSTGSTIIEIDNYDSNKVITSRQFPAAETAMRTFANNLTANVLTGFIGSIQPTGTQPNTGSYVIRITDNRDTRLTATSGLKELVIHATVQGDNFTYNPREVEGIFYTSALGQTITVPEFPIVWAIFNIVNPGVDYDRIESAGVLRYVNVTGMDADAQHGIHFVFQGRYYRVFDIDGELNYVEEIPPAVNQFVNRLKNNGLSETEYSFDTQYDEASQAYIVTVTKTPAPTESGMFESMSFKVSGEGEFRCDLERCDMGSVAYTRISGVDAGLLLQGIMVSDPKDDMDPRDALMKLAELRVDAVEPGGPIHIVWNNQYFKISYGENPRTGGNVVFEPESAVEHYTAWLSEELPAGLVAVITPGDGVYHISIQSVVPCDLNCTDGDLKSITYDISESGEVITSTVKWTYFSTMGDIVSEGPLSVISAENYVGGPSPLEGVLYAFASEDSENSGTPTTSDDSTEPYYVVVATKLVHVPGASEWKWTTQQVVHFYNSEEICWILEHAVTTSPLVEPKPEDWEYEDMIFPLPGVPDQDYVEWTITWQSDYELKKGWKTSVHRRMYPWIF